MYSDPSRNKIKICCEKVAKYYLSLFCLKIFISFFIFPNSNALQKNSTAAEVSLQKEKYMIKQYSFFISDFKSNPTQLQIRRF